MKQLQYIIVMMCLVLTLGCKFHTAPNGVYFPYGWGEPPEIQTKDYVKLPYQYGHGSSTLRNWIELNTQRDRINTHLNNLPHDAGALIK